MGCCRLFTILTVMRTGAVIPAARGEIEIADWVWTIPAARMKGERAKEDTKDFRVPLSAAALTIAGEIRHDGVDFLFPGGQCSKPLSNMAMLTTHGFRSCFKDWAHECTNFQREVIEMALAHTIDSKVEAAYRPGELFE
jgi:integrase